MKYDILKNDWNSTQIGNAITILTSVNNKNPMTSKAPYDSLIKRLKQIQKTYNGK
jgi:hypothetical protein